MVLAQTAARPNYVTKASAATSRVRISKALSRSNWLDGYLVVSWRRGRQPADIYLPNWVAPNEAIFGTLFAVNLR
jgi:hypothetical protein